MVSCARFFCVAKRKKLGNGLNAGTGICGDGGLAHAIVTAVVVSEPWTRETMGAAGQRSLTPQTASEITKGLSALLCRTTVGNSPAQGWCAPLGAGKEQAWTQEALCNTGVGVPEPRMPVL